MSCDFSGGGLCKPRKKSNNKERHDVDIHEKLNDNCLIKNLGCLFHVCCHYNLWDLMLTITILYRGTRVQGSTQCIPENSILLSQMGQQISHRNFQAAGTGANQNHAVKNALRCDKTWEAHSDRNLPIPASIPEPTFSEQDMQFMQSVEDSGSCHATTLPMNVIPYSTMPMTSTTTVLESPMVSTTASFQVRMVTNHTKAFMLQLL